MYPYLEQFTMDVARELRKELGGRPDFIIGNYSDGAPPLWYIGFRD